MAHDQQMPQQSATDNNLSGILFMLSGIFVLTIMDVAAKILVEADYSPFQILAFRGWIITATFLAWFAAKGQLGKLKSNRGKHLAIRGVIGFFAPFLFFTALGELPLADTVVIFFAAPFLMTALSIPLLKETVGRYRWAAIAVGFIGVIIVIQPSGGDFKTGTLYAMGACLAYSLVQLMTRWMSNTETPIRLVFSFNLVVAIIGTAALPFVWKPMSFEHVMVLLALSAIAMLGHTLMTTAFTRAPISVIAPFEYSALLWTTIFGFVIWGDFPANQIWIGAGIIIVCGIYMIHRERVAKKSEPRETLNI